MTDSEPFDVTADLGDGATVPNASRSTDDVVPGTIGRYRVDSVLGQGGFGVVYLAYDDALNRRVAIKVPNERLIKQADQAALYLEEARAVAHLDHPCIVPVFDIGTADKFPCFVVSKYIDGHNLAQVARESGLAFRDTAKIVASVADALHFGHQKGIIHRDVKPANILLDRAGKPFLVDYGLALQDRNPDDAFRCAGTPTYMSPEQARGEGHRVDGRSDIFSLGVVLYELLVGRRPFRGKTTAEILESVTKVDPRPPRQANDKIPRELERICLKALSRRTTDRYTTALDMAEDLRHFIELADQSVDASSQVSAQSQQLVSTDVSSPSTQASANVSSASTPVSSAMPSWVGQPAPQLVPKGLRSFDEHDSDFFLELLPGARDRDGLPDAIRFWKTRIDQLDRDATFSVGLIYGPSGCGKSSFAKAGLLPHLGQHVHAIYIEATADETESRLLHGLRKSVRLTGERSLTDTIAALRHGDGLDDDEKVLIVIDQFEQWLHARLEHDDHELIDAIRQCDGGRVQCVVMIRDDFWMAATRFMRAVEVSLAEGENSLAVDLFEPRHAKRVLASFGRAFGTLPPDSAQTTRNQTAFLEQAIDDIAQDGKVVCVRLALFAEMMKGREWKPASLQSVGGAEGVGAVFLEETFSARTAPPLHRVHQKAARAVLNRLLPEHGSDIKGHMRSRHELLECSGYQDRVDEFNELMRLLDGELRLITPTDSEGSQRPSEDTDDSCYQLAHDYLVPSLRDWLTRKQKETPRGRAELRQEELAALWNAKPERQRLPTLLEWIRLAVFTSRSGRTAGQQKMMSAATRHHSLRLGALACVLAAAGWGVREYSGRLEASALIDQLLTAEMERVPGIVDQLEDNGHWDATVVEASVKDTPVDSTERIRAGLLLLADQPSEAGPLIDRLLVSPVSELQIICSRLRKCGVDAIPSLQSTLDDTDESARRRFNAALAVAWHASNSGIDCDPYLRPHGAFVTDQLVDRSLSHPAESALRIELLRPVRRTMIDRLHEHFVSDDVVRRAVATGVARDYVSDLPDALSVFVMEANEDQFAIMYPLVQTHADEYVKLMETELQQSVDSISDPDKKKTLARRHANAAVCLMRLQQPESVWPLLEHQPDPRSRSWFIKRAAQLGVPPELLIDRYGSEADISSRRALLLAIGNYDPDQIAKASRELTIERCKTLAGSEPDAGLRSAAQWLLRNWKIPVEPTEQPGQLNPIDNRNWYTAAEGHTMVVIDAQNDSSVGHVFDIATKEPTIAQVRAWYPRKNISPDYQPSEDCACGLMTWYQAIAYCQWLNEQAGIDEDQWCYPKFDPNDPGFTVIEADLSKTGFRLPTDAEWEHACRAGSVTSYFFGESPELLPEYAWSSQDQPEYVFPVGLLKPNDLGLFDMYGNLNEWRADVRHGNMVSVGGGSFGSSASRMTSSNKGGAVPSTRYNSYGMRVARTRNASD